MTEAWTRDHVRAIDDRLAATAVFDVADTTPAVPHLHLWDLWPIRDHLGEIPSVDGAHYWMALSAPRQLQPSARHDVARIRLLKTDGTEWHDLGDVFPPAATAGSREWAGSAVLGPEDDRIHVRYTASGRLGERRPSFVQRIFEATARFDPTADPVLSDWSDHRELVRQGGDHYQSTLTQVTGAAGYIKAFRDPFVYIDPVDSRHHLLFTASLANSTTDFDGVVGVATRRDFDDAWVLQPPVLTADGVNNEMERPHVVRHDGLYHLFFSTQARTFHPDVEGPTGLYGFVGESMSGPWRPLNGSGLVMRNPVEEPYQAYSWLVLHDLRVTAFVDMHSLGGRHPDDVEASGGMPDHFGGTVAPFQQLRLEGDQAFVIR